MPKVRRLEEVLMENPGFSKKIGWNLILGNEGGLENLPRFGATVRVVICDDEGNPRYDQYMVIQSPGALSVPWYGRHDEERIGVITQVRPVIVLPETYNSLWQDFVARFQADKDRKYEHLQDFLDKLHHYQGTFRSLEVPGGFGKILDKRATTPLETALTTAVDKLNEELGEFVKGAQFLGYINSDRAFYAADNAVYAIEVDPTRRPVSQPERDEMILKAEYVPKSELNSRIRRGEMICALSLAALKLYDVHNS